MNKPSILVIENNAHEQETLSFLAEQNQFKAHVVPNCKEAIGAFLTDSYALVLVDARLLQEDGGKDFIEQLQTIQQQRGGYTPVVALADQSLAEKLPTKSEIDGYLEKPYSSEQFKEKVVALASGTKY